MGDKKNDEENISDINFYLNTTRDPKLGNYLVPDYVGGKVAIDLGSNLCLFEEKYHDRFDEIYFFEASYKNYTRGTLNLMNKSIKNCVGFNLAASGKSGKIVKIFSSKSGDSGSGSIVKVDSNNLKDYHNILTISFKDILKLINKEFINYLKVDIEGAEYELLKNADLSKVEFIAIEIHNMLGEEKIQKIKDKLLKTHKVVKSISAIPNARNEESCYQLIK